MPQINISNLEPEIFELDDNIIVPLTDDEAAQVSGGISAFDGTITYDALGNVTGWGGDGGPRHRPVYRSSR
ncbi:hypothetical protein H6G91_29510 [Nostoc muscorum FACHB-395]|nr:hypothetical protein [Desmonostoc muscorum FACHB-395]